MTESPAPAPADAAAYVLAGAARDKPVFVPDAKESDHNESANNEEYREAKGEGRILLSDGSIEGPRVVYSLGAGGRA